ncbi:MAG TPA: TetR/AcrR family transcriptional regulator [Hyphomonas sp.]|nr:TetR/AcrR family transcriptional regulator [Hyphomonas sp.]MCB9970595.1 TetR/AcrR family transcriptional regulator [Hyphomonas sp.]HPE47321.1 TetR/AcrR family transcriptional regulator [Hyphomonas sp.]
MTSNDNTVNIKSRGRRYHHGDLRSALVEEGLAELETTAPEDLSLREIARRAGVSATAVYRHFPDKAALLDALCAVASEKMAVAFRKAMAGKAEGLEAFTAMGQEYVRFALANPNLFRLMTTSTPPDPGCDDAGVPAESSFGMLLRALRDLMPPGATAEERDIKRIQAWSMVHGLAMLMLDGQVPADDALIGKVVKATFL